MVSLLHRLPASLPAIGLVLWESSRGWKNGKGAEGAFLSASVKLGKDMIISFRYPSMCQGGEDWGVSMISTHLGSFIRH